MYVICSLVENKVSINLGVKFNLIYDDYFI